MTLQQLKYVITVAETGTITEAAKKLYISQPSLTNAIHDLEKEMNVEIFHRTNKGIDISKEGEDFLGYARQVVEQYQLVEDRYIEKKAMDTRRDRTEVAQEILDSYDPAQ